jgi:uncharacterized protein
MIQFNIYALDHTDKECLNRRMSVRPAHLEGVKNLRNNGNYVIGAALLDEEGKMIGSNMIVQFETEAEFYDYLKSEPYVTGVVWGNMTIRKTRVAVVDML